MKIKENVILQGLHPIFRKVFVYLDKLYKQYGVELVITCGLDGEHSPGSKHYFGFAIDIRIRDFNDIEKQIVYKKIKNDLKLFFDVILHPTHIHIELEL